MPQAFRPGCARAQSRNQLLTKEDQITKSNIIKEESKALRELREDKKRMVLTPDKGVAMMVMDRKEYMEKVEDLLVQLA